MKLDDRKGSYQTMSLFGDVVRWAEEMLLLWKKIVPPQPPQLPPAEKAAWPEMAHRIRQKMEACGNDIKFVQICVRLFEAVF
jgi:hypothetical protein